MDFGLKDQKQSNLKIMMFVDGKRTIYKKTIIKIIFDS